MSIIIVLRATLLLLIVLVSGVLILSVAMMATTILVLVVTLVRVVVRLVVGGALALHFLHLASARVWGGRKAGGFPETTARVFVILMKGPTMAV